MDESFKSKQFHKFATLTNKSKNMGPNIKHIVNFERIYVISFICSNISD